MTKKRVISFVSLGLVVLSIIFYYVAITSNVFAIKLTELDNMYENLANDPYGISFTGESMSEDKDYFVLEIGEYNGYKVTINRYNPFFDVVIDDADNLRTDVIYDIITFDITTWKGNKNINVYSLQSDVPYFFDTDDLSKVTKVSSTHVIDPFYENLADLLLSISLAFLAISFLFTDILEDTKKLKNNYLPVTLLGVLGFLVMFLLDATVSRLTEILDFSSISANQMLIERLLFKDGFVFLIVSSVIFAPMYEELFFRKFLFSKIKSDKIALIVSSILFGAMHLIVETDILTALIHSISYIGSGFVLGLIYLKTNKNIYASFLAHFLINLLSIILIYA